MIKKVIANTMKLDTTNTISRIVFQWDGEENNSSLRFFPLVDKRCLCFTVFY